jgi:DUF1680 family protein
VNGEAQPTPSPGSFARIERALQSGDEVGIEFPMQPRISRWFHNSVAVERGPLVFSYGMEEDWVKLRDRGMTADWQVFPRSAWNYGLALSEQSPQDSIAVTEKELGPGVFTRRHAPVELKVKARLLDSWRAEDGAANPLPQSPANSSQPDQELTLIPYAAAKLRITAFPTI